MSTWWHVHSGPPYVCHGGADRRADAELHAETLREDGRTAAFVVESKHALDERCAYAQPGWVAVRGWYPR
jgi:hypothetical protein